MKETIKAILGLLVLFLLVPVCVVLYVLYETGNISEDLFGPIILFAAGANVTIWVITCILDKKFGLEASVLAKRFPGKRYPFQVLLICVLVVSAASGYAGYYFGEDAGYNKGSEAKNSYVAAVAENNRERGYAEGYEDGYDDGRAEVSGSTSASSSSGSSSDTRSETVYVTNSGSKYHRWGCQYLWDSSNAISLNEAIVRGYTACSKCW